MKESEMINPSFILMDCRRNTKQPVMRMTILVKPKLNGLYVEIKKPKMRFVTNRIAVIINIVFFISDYIWGGSGGGHGDANAGTFLIAAQFGIPTVQTKVSSLMVPCAFIWLI